MLKIDLVKRQFPEIFRVFISGSSSSGKTYFARKLLSEKLFRCDRIYYFHPDVGEKFPIDWEDHLKIPLMTQPNLPSLKDLKSFPQYSCIVLDDLYKQASNSDDIDYLFRVLSSKKKLHVIIMTQRYFAERGNSLNLRNSSNFHVLMNNSDARINDRVGHTMKLKPQIDLAEKSNSQKLYPYIFIDRSNQARISGLQVYTEIFGLYKRVIFNFMECVVYPLVEFETRYKLLDRTTAIERRDGDNEKKVLPKESSKDRKSTTGNTTNNYFTSKIQKRFKEERHLDAKINAALRRYKQRSLL